MAIGTYFDGRRLIRPQAATKIDDTGMFGRGLVSASNLAIIGECTGGQPQRVQYFTDPSTAKAILRSGKLLQAIQRAYDPSSEIGGAYTVAAVRVNPATQALLLLRDTSANPLIKLTSVDWGIWNNQIKVRVETGTNSGTKKVTITYGTAFDQGDNIERKSFYLACSDPLAQSATFAINDSLTAKTLITDVTSAAQKAYYDDGATASDITTASRGVGTLFTVALDTTKYLYIGSDTQFNKIQFNIGAGVANAVVADMVLEYWNGTAWTALSFYSDGTASGGATLAQTGVLHFFNSLYTMPTSWQKYAPTLSGPTTAAELYWVRISASAGLTGAATFDYAWLDKNISVALTSYPTIQELVDYLDALPGYEAVVATSKPTTELSTNLDDTSASPSNLIPTGNTTTTAPYSTGTTLNVSSITGFAIGDYIVIARADGTAEETRKIASLSAGVINVDFALSTTYASGSTVRKSVLAYSNLQAVVDWINTNSAYVTAEDYDTISEWTVSTAYTVGTVVEPVTPNNFAYECIVAGISHSTTEPVWPTTVGQTITDGTVTWITRTYARKALANLADTYMTGGSEGTTTQADWDAALELLQVEDIQLVNAVSTDPSIWASVSTHVTYMSGVGKKERVGLVGGFSVSDGYAGGLGKWNNTTNIANSIDAMIAYALQLNSDRMVYVGPGFTAYDENGTLTTYDGAIAAALVAGMAAGGGGTDIADALTHRSIKVVGLEYNFKWADLDRLLEGGVCPLEFEPGYGFRVAQSITTWLRNDKYVRRELSVRRTADFVARNVRDRLERDFVGRKGTITTLISIKNATASVLTQMSRAGLLAGDTSNPPFKNIQVRLDGDIAYVDFECSPVIPINYIPVTIHLTTFSTTLVA